MKNLILIILAIFVFSCSSSSDDEKDKTAPGVLSQIKTTSSNGSITFTWQLPSDKDISSIKIYYKSANSDYTLSTNTTLFGLDSAKITGLTNYTEYTFQLSAVDKSGNEGVKSSEVKATPENYNGSMTDIWTKISSSDMSALSLIETLLQQDFVKSDAAKTSLLRDAKGWHYYKQGNGLHTDPNYTTAYNELLSANIEDSKAGVAIIGYLLKNFQPSLEAAKEFKSKLSYTHSNGLTDINGEKVLLNGAWSAYRLEDYVEVKSFLDILDPSTTHTTDPNELFDALVNFSK